MQDWAEQKIETLSKGMSQKVQFIAAVISRAGAAHPRRAVLAASIRSTPRRSRTPSSTAPPRHHRRLQHARHGDRRADVRSHLHDLPRPEGARRHARGDPGAVRRRHRPRAHRRRRRRARRHAGRRRRSTTTGKLQEVRARRRPAAVPAGARRAHARSHHFEVTRPSLHDIFVRIARPTGGAALVSLNKILAVAEAEFRAHGALEGVPRQHQRPAHLDPRDELRAEADLGARRHVDEALRRHRSDRAATTTRSPRRRRRATRRSTPSRRRTRRASRSSRPSASPPTATRARRGAPGAVGARAQGGALRLRRDPGRARSREAPLLLGPSRVRRSVALAAQDARRHAARPTLRRRHARSRSSSPRSRARCRPTSSACGRATPTARVHPAEKQDEVRAVVIPMAAVFLLFFFVVTSVPQLMNSVLTEKTSRISEVLLGSLTPTELMTGKLLGSVGGVAAARHDLPDRGAVGRGAHGLRGRGAAGADRAGSSCSWCWRCCSTGRCRWPSARRATTSRTRRT